MTPSDDAAVHDDDCIQPPSATTELTSNDDDQRHQQPTPIVLCVMDMSLPCVGRSGTRLNFCGVSPRDEAAEREEGEGQRGGEIVTGDGSQGHRPRTFPCAMSSCTPPPTLRGRRAVSSRSASRGRQRGRQSQQGGPPRRSASDGQRLVAVTQWEEIFRKEQEEAAAHRRERFAANRRRWAELCIRLSGRQRVMTMPVQSPSDSSLSSVPPLSLRNTRARQTNAMSQEPTIGRVHRGPWSMGRDHWARAPRPMGHGARPLGALQTRN